MKRIQKEVKKERRDSDKIEKEMGRKEMIPEQRSNKIKINQKTPNRR